MEKVESVRRFFFDEIPFPVILRILSRLPTKSCLNCKLVCKEWNCIIKDPEFAKVRRSLGRYSFLLLRGKFIEGKKEMERNFVLLDLEKPLKVDEMHNLSVSADSMVKFKSKFIEENEGLELVNECNGVICLKQTMEWGSYIITNLLTAQYEIIKQSPIPSCLVTAYGMGCCPVSHQFKVLRILKYYSRDGTKYVAELQTLGTGQWRSTGEPPLEKMIQTPCSLKGSLHWYSYKDNCIWSFDFGSEEFLRIPVPDEVTKIRDFQGSRILSVFDSCLCLSDKHDIWVMKEYGVKDSWVKQFEFEKDEKSHMPMMQMDGKEMLVSSRGKYGLAVGDNESGKCKQVLVLGVLRFVAVMTSDAKFYKSPNFMTISA